MSWHKVFIITLAIILISCAKNIITIYQDRAPSQHLEYISALYDEYAGDIDNAIDEYYELYKDYDDEYYFSRALELGIKAKNPQAMKLISLNPNAEASLAIRAKLERLPSAQKYQNLKQLYVNYHKEYYLYELLKLCNESKKSIASTIHKVCAKDKSTITKLDDLINSKPIFYDMEYKNYSYPMLLREILEFDTLYHVSSDRAALLKELNISKLDCADDISRCLGTMDILLYQGGFDDLFALASKLKSSLSYDMSSFINTMRFDAFYFKLLKIDKSLAKRFLDQAYIAYDGVDLRAYHKQLSTNDMGFVRAFDSARAHMTAYSISLQRHIASQPAPRTRLDTSVPPSIIDYYLIISSDEMINTAISSYTPAQMPRPYYQLKSALDSLYSGDCAKANRALDGIDSSLEYKVMIGEYVFDIEQLADIISSCMDLHE